MALSLSRRERTLIWLAVVGAALVGGYVYVVEPLRERAQEYAELIPAREARLERRRQLIAQREALTAELESASHRVDGLSARLLQGPTPPLAASELQRLIKDTAAQVSVEVRSERVLPTVDRGGVVEVPLEITVAGGVRQCVMLLAEIEQIPKLLTVQDLKVRVIASGQPRDLLTTITVSGYLRGGPPGPRPGESPAAPGGQEPRG